MQVRMPWWWCPLQSPALHPAEPSLRSLPLALGKPKSCQDQILWSQILPDHVLTRKGQRHGRSALPLLQSHQRHRHLLQALGCLRFCCLVASRVGGTTSFSSASLGSQYECWGPTGCQGGGAVDCIPHPVVCRGSGSSADNSF